MRSVVARAGASFLLSDGFRMTIPGLFSGAASTCGMNGGLLLNASFQDTGLPAPARAAAQITVWTLADGNLTLAEDFTCDPAAELGAPGACPVRAYCPPAWVGAGRIDPAFYGGWAAGVDRRCIARQVWFALPNATDAAAFPYDAFAPVALACANVFSLAVDTEGRQQYGALVCNNPVHRAIDCWLSLAKGTGYMPACAGQPVTCYSNARGWAAGLWWDGVPDLVFSENAGDWTAEHFAAVASLVNGERWFAPDTNASVELLSQALLDAYGVSIVNGSLRSRYEFQGLLAPTSQFGATFASKLGGPQLINPAAYSSDGTQVVIGTSMPTFNFDMDGDSALAQPPVDTIFADPEYSTLLATSLVYVPLYWLGGTYTNYSNTNLAQDNLGIVGYLLQALSPPPTASPTASPVPPTPASNTSAPSRSPTPEATILPPVWFEFAGSWLANMTAVLRRNWRFRQPGFVTSISGFAASQVGLVQFTPSFDGDYFQLITQSGAVCGTLLRVTKGTRYLLDCRAIQQFAPNDTQLPDVHAAIATTNASLNAATAVVENGLQLAGGGVALLELFELAFFIAAFVAMGTTDLGGMRAHYTPADFFAPLNSTAAFPDRYVFDTAAGFYLDGWFRALVQPYFLDPSELVVLLENDNTNHTTYNEAWEQLAAQIVTEHRWPFNAPLRGAYEALEAAGGAWSRPLDLQDPADQQYLFGVWASRLAPRRCTHDVECQTWSRAGAAAAAAAAAATCVFDAADARPWRNGDGYTSSASAGDEGGCDAHRTQALGFWNASLLNTDCVWGLGPPTEAAWLASAQRQAAVAAVLASFPTAYSAQPTLLYDAAAYPFAGVLASGCAGCDPQAALDVQNATLWCRLPADPPGDGSLYFTAGLLCSGRGTARLQVDPPANASLQLFGGAAAGPPRTPACQSVSVSWPGGGAAQLDCTYYGASAARCGSGLPGEPTLLVAAGDAYWRGGGLAAAATALVEVGAAPTFAAVFARQYTLGGAGDGFPALQVQCNHALLADPTRAADLVLAWGDPPAPLRAVPLPGQLNPWLAQLDLRPLT